MTSFRDFIEKNYPFLMESGLDKKKLARGYSGVFLDKFFGSNGKENLFITTKEESIELINNKYNFAELLFITDEDTIKKYLGSKTIEPDENQSKRLLKGSEGPRFQYRKTGSDKIENNTISLSNLLKTPEFGGQGGGAGKITAADWEKVIVVANNLKLTPDEMNTVIKMGLEGAITGGKVENWKERFGGAIENGKVKNWKKQFEGTMLTAGLKIVDKLSTELKDQTMIHYGANKTETGLTEAWDGYFKTMTDKSAPSATKIPKTDMYIGDDINISLKKEGGSQLMSGGKGETLATLCFAYENMQEEDFDANFQETFKELTSKMNKTFTEKFKNVSINDIKKRISAGDKSPLVTAVNTQLDNNAKMTVAIKKLTENIKFKEAMVREAMTGTNKFKLSRPKSTHIMVFSEDGTTATLDKISNELISDYAQKTHFVFTMKSASGSSQAVLRGIVEAERIDLFESTFNEAFDEFAMINEGFDLFKKGKDFILSFIKKWVDKIIAAVKSSFSKLLALGDLTIDANSPEINFAI